MRRIREGEERRRETSPETHRKNLKKQNWGYLRLGHELEKQQHRKEEGIEKEKDLTIDQPDGGRKRQNSEKTTGFLLHRSLSSMALQTI